MWQGYMEKKWMCWLSWKDISIPKEGGGLGIKKDIQHSPNIYMEMEMHDR